MLAPFFKDNETGQIFEWSQRLENVYLQRRLVPYTPEGWEEPKQGGLKVPPVFEEVVLEVFDYDNATRKQLFDHCKKTYNHTLEWTGKAKMIAAYVKIDKG